MRRCSEKAAAVLLAMLACCAPHAEAPTTKPLPSRGLDAGAPERPDSGSLVLPETVADSPEEPPIADDEKPNPSAFEQDENFLSNAKLGKSALCSMVPSHMAEIQATVAAQKAPAFVDKTGPTSIPKAPLRLDTVVRRFGLRPSERGLLEKNGFVVPARLTFPSYTVAYHEIYQSELPIYVSVDSIFHAFFATFDDLMASVEARRLAPILSRMLDRLADSLQTMKAELPPLVVSDLDLYLSVARSLLSGSVVAGIEGPRDDVRRIAEDAVKADAMSTIDLFGRSRVVDFSLYRPRGHYARRRGIARYFRAAMWLSRLEFNLVSRSSRSSAPGVVPNPEETPREVMDALGLAMLVERAGAVRDLGVIERAWGLLASGREDVSIPALSELRKKAGIARLDEPEATGKLRAAIGDGYRRTMRVHYMPEGSTDLPVIATLLGPRLAADTVATRPLVHSEIAGRYDIGVADMAYAFGHRRALAYLEAERKAFPTLDTQLEKAKEIVFAKHEEPGLYGAWLSSIRALSDVPKGTRPSFMRTAAFEDLRLGSFVSAYGQLRHANVLVAGQSYDEGACAVPDGFVEPAPSVYEGLMEVAKRGKAAMAELDPNDALGGGAFFSRFGTIAEVLRAISLSELSGKPLSREALAFLSMVVEIHGVDIGTGFNTTYNGWYFDLFLTRPEGTTEAPPGRSEHPSMRAPTFVADFYTSTNTGSVAYAGAQLPRLGIFVVDVGGPPRVVVGPVAHALEHKGPLSARLTDEDVEKLEDLSEPWAKSHVVPPPPEPPLLVRIEQVEDYPDERKEGRSTPFKIHVESNRDLGPVTIERLDHNRQVKDTVTQNVGTKRVPFVFPSRRQKVVDGTRATEGLKIRVGEFESMLKFRYVDVMAFGGMQAPPSPNP